MSSDTDDFLREFRAHFPDAGVPKLCRAPGRVNLLGEHIDYNGLPVLPMTIDREIRIAFAPRTDSTIRLHEIDTAYPQAEFVNEPAIPASPRGAWENYCKAAVHGLNAHLQPASFPGMDLLVEGTIPMAAGLSSSTALVVASALAYLNVLGVPLDKSGISRIELAGLLADAERYVGTQGGGMDQAIILLGGEGAACKINFHPLRVEQAPLVPGHAIVVCNSLVKADKSGGALHRYNEGPLSCRLIRAMVERKAQEEFGPEIEFDRLDDLWSGPLCLTNAEVETLFAQTFHRETTSLAEAARFLELSVDEIRAKWLGDLPEPEGGFRLQARARHQIAEFKRVELGRDCLLAGDAPGFGALMNASHESCRVDYRVSCDELDQLVAAARASGSLGSRLTGAGFGGCTVNLVPASHTSEFRRQIEKRYYEPLARHRGITANLDAAVLVVQPSLAAGYS
ncbi:MAG: galactokinase [Candidatus Hydrogenedentales bacterium]|jgi:N-acetylgalactosamine kinase